MTHLPLICPWEKRISVYSGHMAHDEDHFVWKFQAKVTSFAHSSHDLASRRSLAEFLASEVPNGFLTKCVFL
jgi:hypothetical protein